MLVVHVDGMNYESVKRRDYRMQEMREGCKINTSMV
jgi:hypothetical protein